MLIPLLLLLLLLVQVLMKVVSNVEACVLVGGCVLAVNLLTVVHDASERTAIPLQSNLIAATAFMEPLKEWMFMDKNNAQVGPVEKDAVRRFRSKAEIDWTTRCWAAGMPDWKRLKRHPRAQVGHGCSSSCSYSSPGRVMMLNVLFSQIPIKPCV